MAMQAPGTGLSELAARAADALGELVETVPRLSSAELDCLATYHPFATMEWLCALRDTCSGHLTEDVRLIDALEVRLGERDVEVASLRVQIAELRRALDGAQRSSWRFMEAAKRDSPNPELVRSHNNICLYAAKPGGESSSPSPLCSPCDDGDASAPSGDDCADGHAGWACRTAPSDRNVRAPMPPLRSRAACAHRGRRRQPSYRGGSGRTCAGQTRS